MTTYLPRSAWTDTRPDGPSPSTRLRGFAVHWPASRGVIGTDKDKIARLLNGWRVQHMKPTRDGGLGASDIAYQDAVDLAGRVWSLRGVNHRAGANGGTEQNLTHGALLVVMGMDEDVTPELIEAVRDWRDDRFLKAHPNATDVVGHRDLNQTACPGDKLYALVRSGAFTKAPERPPAIKPPAEEIDMPLSDADWTRLRKEMDDAIERSWTTKRPIRSDLAAMIGEKTASRQDLSERGWTWARDGNKRIFTVLKHFGLKD